MLFNIFNSQLLCFPNDEVHLFVVVILDTLRRVGGRGRQEGVKVVLPLLIKVKRKLS